MIVVGIGEYAISNNTEKSIVTFALGSCVALIIHCPYNKITALAHIVLPTRENQVISKHNNKVGYYADTIIPVLLDEFLIKNKCVKNTLEISLVGGASSKKEDDFFQIGKKNAEKVLSLLADNDLKPNFMDVGKHVSRTVKVSIETGKVNIKTRDMII